MSGYYTYKDQASKLHKRKLIMFMFVGLIIWSSAMMLLYMITDNLIGWATTSGATLIDAGKSLAGKEVTTAFDALNLSQYAKPAVTFLRAFLGPVAWFIWTLGVIIILSLPVLYRQLQNNRLIRRN